MNNSLLYDKTYVEAVKDTIKQVTVEYAIINQDEHFFENASRLMFKTLVLSYSYSTVLSFHPM